MIYTAAKTAKLRLWVYDGFQAQQAQDGHEAQGEDMYGTKANKGGRHSIWVHYFIFSKRSLSTLFTRK